MDQNELCKVYELLLNNDVDPMLLLALVITPQILCKHTTWGTNLLKLLEGYNVKLLHESACAHVQGVMDEIMDGSTPLYNPFVEWATKRPLDTVNGRCITGMQKATVIQDFQSRVGRDPSNGENGIVYPWLAQVSIAHDEPWKVQLKTGAVVPSCGQGSKKSKFKINTANQVRTCVLVIRKTTHIAVFVTHLLWSQVNRQFFLYTSILPALWACGTRFTSMCDHKYLSTLECPLVEQGIIKFYIDWERLLSTMPLGMSVAGLRNLALQTPSIMCKILQHYGCIESSTDVCVVVKEGVLYTKCVWW